MIPLLKILPKFFGLWDVLYLRLISTIKRTTTVEPIWPKYTRYPGAKGRKRDADTALQAFRPEDWLRPPAVAEQLDVEPRRKPIAVFFALLHDPARLAAQFFYRLTLRHDQDAP